ncbi:MAG: DUF2937 family protein [Proteobacteria bacterium]|nr:DUF2937 family protein [Pseudomonadota bacterium]
MRALHELTAIAFAVLVGFAVSQLPRFIQEYEQRLGGALQEASRQLDEFRRNAEAAGVSFNEYVGRHLDGSDAALRATGRTIQGSVLRVADLREQVQRLADASKFAKPVVLARGYDTSLVRATWERFQVTATFDPAFGAIGLVLGWLLNALLWRLMPKRRAYG